MDSNNSEMDRKRKISGHDLQIQTKYPTTDFHVQENDEKDLLTLSLSTFHHHPAAAATLPQPPHLPFINPPTIPVPPPETAQSPNYPAVAGTIRHRRARRNPTKTPPVGKSATIPPPFPWSDNCRATVRSLSYLRSQQISSISGDVQCKKCERRFTMEFDLEQKFGEIATFIAENKASMHHRAPKIWMNPALPKCRFCDQDNSVRPVIADKKRSINWLFMLLGQMLGCCTLEQLKYFCKHTKNHRTGAKDRVLFLAYLGLCRQLDPNGPFDI